MVPLGTPLSHRPLRLGIFVTHPIQYFAPLWRTLAATPGLDLRLHFFSDHSVRGGFDPGFRVNVVWDVPLLDGYRSEFISRDADLSAPASVSLTDADARIHRDHFDVVMIHGYTHRFERQVLRAARRHGVRTLIRGEFSDVTPFRGRGRVKMAIRDLYLRWFYRQVDTFCYVGEEARRHLLRRGVAESRMFFAPYSVDSHLFEGQRQQRSRAAARADLGLHDAHVVLLFSGKLIPRKAPLTLVNAMRHVRGAERIVLLILGEGELRAEVEREARPLLGDRLHMVGFVNQSQLGRYYRAADVSVLPSHFETWGLVVNEAMHFGLPVIVSSKVGCHRDLVIEGRTGMVFTQGDERSLAGCIQRFVDEPELATTMGAHAQAHIGAYSTEASAAGVLRAVGLRG